MTTEATHTDLNVDREEKNSRQKPVHPQLLGRSHVFSRCPGSAAQSSGQGLWVLPGATLWEGADLFPQVL